MPEVLAECVSVIGSYRMLFGSGSHSSSLPKAKFNSLAKLVEKVSGVKIRTSEEAETYAIKPEVVKISEKPEKKEVS